jgi:hypothetical protein
MEETLRLNNQPGGFAMEGLPLTLLVHLSQRAHPYELGKEKKEKL